MGAATPIIKQLKSALLLGKKLLLLDFTCGLLLNYSYRFYMKILSKGVRELCKLYLVHKAVYLDSCRLSATSG
jgi:hypothetical protein